MGYRQRIGKFPKKLYGEHKNKSLEQLTEEFGDEDGYYNVCTLDGHEELLYIPARDYPEKDLWKEFYSFNCKELTENDMYILTKENLESMIKMFEKEIYYYFDDLYKNFDTKMNNIANMIMTRRNDWNIEFTANLNLEPDSALMPSAGALDYFLLNLVAIHKMFDWENDYMIISGW